MSKIDFLRLTFVSSDPPVFKEPKDGELVLYGDPKEPEPYPDYLIDLSSKSARHSAMLKSKIRYICGNGWSIDEFQRNITEIAKIQNLVNWKGDDSFQEFTEKIVTDREYFGAFAIECIWNKTHTKIERIAHLPIALLRAVKKGDTYNFCYLPDWKKIKQYSVAKEKEGFKEFEQLGAGKGASEILYITSSRPQKSGETNVYGRPSYEAAVKLIEADGEVANFRLNNVKNGFWASKMIVFKNGVPTVEEQKAIKDKIVKEHTGSDKAGTFVLAFTEGTDNSGADVIDLAPSDMDKLFIDLDKAIETTIGTAHSITNPALMGVATPGSLGQINDVTASYELFYNTYVIPAQRQIEDAINYIYSFNGLTTGLKLNAVKPLNFMFSEATIKDFLDRDTVVKLIEKQLGIDIAELKKGKFSKQEETDYIINQFYSIGTPSEDEDILEEFEIEKDEEGNYQKDEFYTDKYKQKFASEFSKLERDILGMVKSNPKATAQDISSALKQSEADVQKIMGEMMSAGHLVGELGNLKISESALKTIATEDIDIKVGVKYRYTGPKDSRNREFCANLLRLDKLYTRAELDNIKPSPNAPQDKFSVFDYRGGFYNNGQEITPWCRHRWVSVAVRLK